MKPFNTLVIHYYKKMCQFLREKVIAYQTTKEFSFKEKLIEDGLRVEVTPSWLLSDKRKEIEANQPFTVIRKQEPILFPVEPSESVTEPSESNVNNQSNKVDFETERKKTGESINIEIGGKILEYKLEPLKNNPIKPNEIENKFDEEEQTKLRIIQTFNADPYREPVKVEGKEERLKQLYEQIEYLKAQGYR
ncbi:hypothetical protein [Bacillus sp. ISL-46]|uniref:hypothetical protein n=1 Tax=Bacillus sp. ISL-46 TaxID=2819129 RepID=UPI001BECFBB3|nr:hypothetical protein [Bacillus sp. ISL-46]MBT2723020.1 hypothetical protein [Bacillus sp. ISL-46]